MSDSPSAAEAARYAVVGANHQTADAGFRDRLYIDEDARGGVLQTLRDKGLEQVVIVSTCDRVEFHIAGPEPEKGVGIVQAAVAERLGSRVGAVEEHLFRRYDDDAVRHVFNVACALESQVVGESQVLGQVKQAFTDSQQSGTLGPEIDALYQATFSLAKTVRTETRIGEGAVTVASAAVQIARDLYGDPAKVRVLIIGLGDTGALLLEQFRLSGSKDAVLTGTSRRVERAAKRAGCHYAPIDALPQALVEADAVITAAGSGRYLVDRPMVAEALRIRRGQPLVLFDCGSPEDTDPAIDGLDDAFRYTLSDIERLAREGRFGREEQADNARRMVDEAVVAFQKSQAAQDGVPGLVALRQHFEAARKQVLDRHRNADAEEATRLLVNRLLHAPSAALRDVAAEGGVADLRDTITVNRVLSRLFDLRIEERRDRTTDDGNEE